MANDNKRKRSKNEWWKDPKWHNYGIAIVVVVIGIAVITYFTIGETVEYQDISWNELTKYVYSFES